MSRGVRFSPEAQDDLDELYDYITQARALDTAANYVDAIIAYCVRLADYPHRGRADIRPGLRTIGYQRRVVIAFTVHDDVLVILGVYYGGRDYESLIDH